MALASLRQHDLTVSYLVFLKVAIKIIDKTQLNPTSLQKVRSLIERMTLWWPAAVQLVNASSVLVYWKC